MMFVCVNDQKKKKTLKHNNVFMAKHVKKSD